MLFKIMSQMEAVYFDPEKVGYGKTAIIRVSSYELIPLEHRSKFVDILPLHFYDVTDYEFEMAMTKKYFPISEYHAKYIVEFLLKNIDVDTMIVHCDAGISRSSAMALACCALLKDKNQFYAIRNSKSYHPNQTVYDRIIEAAEPYKDKLAILEELKNVSIIVPSNLLITGE